MDRHPYHSVPEFLAAILPTSPQNQANSWFYRGVADENWPLIASVYRVNAWRPISEHLVTDIATVDDDENMIIGDDAKRLVEHVLHVAESVAKQQGIQIEDDDIFSGLLNISDSRHLFLIGQNPL